MVGKLYVADALALPAKPLKRKNAANGAGTSVPPTPPADEPPKKRRTLTPEQKENMKVARQARAAEKAAQTARETAEREAAAAAAQARKAAAAAKRRATMEAKKQLATGGSENGTVTAASSVTSEEASPPPPSPSKRKRTAAAAPVKVSPEAVAREVENDAAKELPPNWFNTIVELIEREKAEQTGNRVNKKDLKAKASARAEERWSDGMTRDRVRGAVDNHVSKMYEMIFG